MESQDGGVPGRSQEIEDIKTYLTARINNDQSGFLYLAGPTGSGKTMSVDLVLNQLKDVPRFSLNCGALKSSKLTLKAICKGVKLDRPHRYSEEELMRQLEEKFSKQKYILVLDEFDKVQESKNFKLIKTIFSWLRLPKNQLILVGIANTLNLSAKDEVISKIMGPAYNRLRNRFKKIVFKPYSTQDIKSILMWYLNNDENFEDASVDSKALDMIAVKCTREKNGDIRVALDTMTSARDDIMRASRRKISSITKTPEPVANLPTPPATPTSTPPLSPRKECSNIASVANSIRKRSKRTLYEEDTLPLTHQIILSCISRLRLSSTKGKVDLGVCKNMTAKILDAFRLNVLADDDYRQVLTNLETGGLIFFEKAKPRVKIILTAKGSDFCDFIPEKTNIEGELDKITINKNKINLQ